MSVTGHPIETHESSPQKKSLFIGINYLNTKHLLKGCINDVHNLKSFLIRAGFPEHPDVMRTLTDDSNNPETMPTRNNIINSCHWLVKNAKPGDHLFFHFSGHGSQVEDESGDEDDNFDETILPCDFETAGEIIDDLLHEILVKPLVKGVHLTAIFDSCHSGTSLDLPFIYQASGEYETPTLDPQTICKRVFNVALPLIKKGYASAAIDQGTKEFFKGLNVKELHQKNITSNRSDADVLQISGCRDDQTSADASLEGKATGAMSFAFITLLTENPKPTIIELLNGMRVILKERKFSQIPQMSTSHEIDPNSIFSL